MIEIREMKPGEDKLLMDFFKNQHQAAVHSLNETDRIFLFMDESRIDGVLILRQVTPHVSVMLALETALDNWIVQDGLLRTAFNAMNNQGVTWVLADSQQVEKLLALKEHFCPLDQQPELQPLLNELQQLINSQDYQAVSTNVIYQGTCKDGPDVQ